MGFRSGAYAKVWSSESISDVNTKCSISISRKDKRTGEYVEDFHGFVSFAGSATANKALRKLGDVDVKTKQNKDKGVTYYNFFCFSFDPVESGGAQASSSPASPAPLEDGDPDDGHLPF